jgi:hypothetical protein
VTSVTAGTGYCPLLQMRRAPQVTNLTAGTSYRTLLQKTMTGPDAAGRLAAGEDVSTTPRREVEASAAQDAS